MFTNQGKQLRLRSRKELDGFLDMELRRSERYQNFTSILMIGPSPGDGLPAKFRLEEMIQRIARLIQEALRETDLVGAYDRRTIAVVLLYSDKKIAQRVGDRLGGRISNYFGSDPEASSHSFALGGACYPSHATNLECLYDSAKEMLEQAQTERYSCQMVD